MIIFNELKTSDKFICIAKQEKSYLKPGLVCTYTKTIKNYPILRGITLQENRVEYNQCFTQYIHQEDFSCFMPYEGPLEEGQLVKTKRTRL